MANKSWRSTAGIEFFIQIGAPLMFVVKNRKEIAHEQEISTRNVLDFRVRNYTSVGNLWQTELDWV